MPNFQFCIPYNSHEIDHWLLFFISWCTYVRGNAENSTPHRTVHNSLYQIRLRNINWTLTWIIRWQNLTTKLYLESNTVNRYFSQSVVELLSYSESLLRLETAAIYSYRSEKVQGQVVYKKDGFSIIFFILLHIF